MPTEPKKQNFFTRGLAKFASKRVNHQGSYMEGFHPIKGEENKLSRAAFEKYLGRPYDKELLPENEDGTHRLPLETELQFTVDTNFIKNRIEDGNREKTRLINIHADPEYIKARVGAIMSDKKYLDALRHMYKTGEPIVVNEFDAWKDRDKHIFKDEKVNHSVTAPFNLMRNFHFKPNEKTSEVEYRDTYNLNKIPLVDSWYNPFDIKGVVPNAKFKKVK